MVKWVKCGCVRLSKNVRSVVVYFTSDRHADRLVISVEDLFDVIAARAHECDIVECVE